MTPLNFPENCEIRGTAASWPKYWRKILRTLIPDSEVSGTSTGKKKDRNAKWDAVHSQDTLQAFKDSQSPLGKEGYALKE
jgi:hypothetical protein